MSERRPAASLFSHIFKSPLASIQAASEILLKHLDGKLNQKDQQLLEVIARNSKTLDLRVNTLLEVLHKGGGVITQDLLTLALRYDQLESIHDMTYQKPAPPAPIPVIGIEAMTPAPAGPSGRQEDPKIVVHADPEIADLIPKFLQNRRKDIVSIVEALQKKDFEAIKNVAHSIKGAGGGYGFHAVSDLGRMIEDAAREGSLEGVLVAIDKLTDYLDHVVVVYD